MKLPFLLSAVESTNKNYSSITNWNGVTFAMTNLKTVHNFMICVVQCLSFIVISLFLSLSQRNSESFHLKAPKEWNSLIFHHFS